MSEFEIMRQSEALTKKTLRRMLDSLENITIPSMEYGLCNLQTVIIDVVNRIDKYYKDRIGNMFYKVNREEYEGKYKEDLLLFLHSAKFKGSILEIPNETMWDLFIDYVSSIQSLGNVANNEESVININDKYIKKQTKFVMNAYKFHLNFVDEVFELVRSCYLDKFMIIRLDSYENRETELTLIPVIDVNSLTGLESYETLKNYLEEKTNV